MLVPLLFSALVYAPIVLNSFFSDDFYHLYDLVNSSFWQFLFRTHGGHIYVFRNLIFLVCYLFFRTAPFFYYGLAFATHLLNVFLVYRVIRSSGGSARAAVFGATLWGILPADEGAIGWYSVYGHALATTITLSVLVRMSEVAAGAAPLRFEPILWAVALGLGATCFGVGLGLAAAMPVAAFLFLPRSAFRRRAVIALVVLAVLLPVLYRSVEILDSSLHGEPIESVSAAFSAKILPLQVLMLLHLVVFAASSFVFGTFYDPKMFPTGADYCAAVLSGALAIALVARAPSLVRRRAVACALLGVAAYATIAAGRGMFFDPANARTMAAAPRFHYAGPCMLVLAFALLLEGWPRFMSARLKTACLIVWLAAMLRGHQTGRPIDHHDNDRIEARRVLARIESAVDAAPSREEVYVENRAFLSIGPFLIGARPLFPGWGALFAIYHPDGFVKGKRVRFVERDPKVLAARREGRISARLFVSPDEMPASARITEYPRLRPNRAAAGK